MVKTRTETEYAIFGKAGDGNWYKASRNEISSRAEAERKAGEFAEADTAFIEFKIMERTVTITTGDWNESK